MKALSSINSAAYHDLLDYSVTEQGGESVGSLHSLWADQDSGALEFLGVKTGWLFGSNHVVPTAQAQVDEAARTIVVPYALELIKGAPAIAADAEISEEQEAEIFRHYGLGGHGAAATTTTTTAASTTTHARTGASVGDDAAATAATAAGLASTANTTAATATAGADTHAAAAAAATTRREAKAGETIEVALQEERLKVGKRQVEAGGVRLRKIVRTETVNTPVELRREDVVVERVAAKDMRPGDIKAADFQEKDLTLTLHREEAVVAKETVVTGAVRLHKTAETETQTVSDTVRKEDVEVSREGGTSTDVRKDERSGR